MGFLYNIIVYIASGGVWLASFFNKKLKKMVRGHRQTFSILQAGIQKDDRVAWFHAASLGEFEQGRPLMERLRRDHPEYKILLTFFSPSGYEVQKDYKGADVVCYLPFDKKRTVRKFVDASHPEMVFFIKYELWYFYLTTLHKRGIKIYSISSIFRKGQAYFRYKMGLTMLRQFDHFFVQNEQTKQLLASQGIHCVSVTGDTRFDRVIDICRKSAELPIAATFKNGHKVVIAGSSWEPDEAIYIPYFSNHREWKMIIAPHEVHEDRIDKLTKNLEGQKVVRYTVMEQLLSEGKSKEVHEQLTSASVLIVDCFGKLSSIYRYGEIALIGGGFGVGIHNVPEAAVYGIPVLFGPNNQKFREAQALKKCGGAFEYTDAETFSSLMNRLTTDESFLQASGQKAGDYIRSHSGATEKIFNALFRANDEKNS